MATTIKVVASTDDCCVGYDSAYFSATAAGFSAGYSSSSYKDWGSAARFLALNIPAGSTIDSAVLVLTARRDRAKVTVNTRIRCQKTGTPATFSDSADFDARSWTTAFVNWDAIAAWTTNTEYTSPDFKTCVQEVADLGAITDLVVLWDDFEKRSTQVTETERVGQSYNGSSAKAPQLVITFTPPVAAGRSQGHIIG